MSSCLKAALVLAPVLFAAGCAQQPPPPVATAQPMEIDAAMQRRDWERSAAWYPNGDTLAGVQRYPLRPQGGPPGSPDYTNAAVDLATSFGQSIALPFTYLFVPPFAPQVFTGEGIPATYTAMPDMAPPAVSTTYGQPVVTREQELQQLQSPEPLPRPVPPRDPRRGPLGPGDSDFMSSPPTVEEPD